MSPRTLGYSKTQVDRAADVWRAWADGDRRNSDQLVESLDVVEHFRRCHQYPLTKATTGLRSTVNTAGAQVQVSQRLKRFPTILEKLTREPSMKLSRMQDIGGCRAVLPDIASVRAVQKRLERRRGFVRLSDYITQPRESGYRGVHVILRYDDRSIELQLRTPVMHQWAIAVEKMSARVHHDLKSSSGPIEVLELFQLVSEAMQIEEAGLPVSADLIDRITERRLVVLGLLNERAGG